MQEVTLWVIADGHSIAFVASEIPACRRLLTRKLPVKSLCVVRVTTKATRLRRRDEHLSRACEIACASPAIHRRSTRN